MAKPVKTPPLSKSELANLIISELLLPVLGRLELPPPEGSTDH